MSEDELIIESEDDVMFSKIMEEKYKSVSSE